ncbi:MAG: hypothetical protein UT67_C0001G0041 [Candidatus Magasanikbacteria bacterium GW2011_GWA2_40_10]|uniref:Uncharacterized protein n=1 Tax=Candidatus Magasanikbacteria bacterium GW2011_GWA2_40_10 TaxID=1619037 RepID=A0A0G0QDZ0_9BACT|nr:MAG: hypothetical protein UT67_C0001G0041 [Candidatus Magasanikbacteria bacterium GW2011_GWA2_40_10]
MMIAKKNKAIALRKKGRSLREISDLLHISKSTAMVWTLEVRLGKIALKRIENLREKGRKKAIITNKKKRLTIKLDIEKKVRKNFIFKTTTSLSRLLCSLLYWCEGEKNECSIAFTNSDPLLISAFLKLFRSGFQAVESKFRVCLHLHQYHNETKQKRYWSKVTQIPIKQFFVYRKSNTGKSIKKDYPGCVSIRYHDYTKALELGFYYKIFAKNYRGLV